MRAEDFIDGVDDTKGRSGLFTKTFLRKPANDAPEIDVNANTTVFVHTRNLYKGYRKKVKSFTPSKDTKQLDDLGEYLELALTVI